MTSGWAHSVVRTAVVRGPAEQSPGLVEKGTRGGSGGVVAGMSLRIQFRAFPTSFKEASCAIVGGIGGDPPKS